jgi:hypothetical protein
MKNHSDKEVLWPKTYPYEPTEADDTNPNSFSNLERTI